MARLRDGDQAVIGDGIADEPVQAGDHLLVMGPVAELNALADSL